MKPVAIVTKYTMSGIDNFCLERITKKHLPEGTLLYTAPRELSDDLIEAIALNYVGDDDELDIIGFARAILKKASEK